jgi:hypothetical protein
MVQTIPTKKRCTGVLPMHDWLGRLLGQEVMSAILDVDLSTFCGRIGNLYGRHGLSPPFGLRDAAESWITKGIPLTHCVDVIERYLNRYASSCYSGSGDRNFAWLNSLIHTSWYERQVQRVANRPCVDRQPGANHEVDATPSPTRGAPAGNRSDAPGCCGADQAPPHSVSSIGQNRKQPKRVDQAIAFLRRELANGEVAATRLEEKAMTSGISPRTLDRARTRLKVISRRTGFAKKGKCWCSLPTTP